MQYERKMCWAQRIVGRREQGHSKVYGKRIIQHLPHDPIRKHTYSNVADGSFHINLCLSIAYTALRPGDGLEALNCVSIDSSHCESRVRLPVNFVAEANATTLIEDV
jgi:hypothetical protein